MKLLTTIFFLALVCLLTSASRSQHSRQNFQSGGDSWPSFMTQGAPPDPQSAMASNSLPKPMALRWDASFSSSSKSIDGGLIRTFDTVGDIVYVGGSFATLGSLSANGIAQYNLTTGTWNGLGGGLNGRVDCIVHRNGLIYAGGAFAQTADATPIQVANIAVWDGTTWAPVGNGFDREVTSLAFLGNTLVAGGYFTHSGTDSANYLASWDGAAWNILGDGTSFPVYALAAKGDSLFVGGDFYRAGGVVASSIAMYRQNNWTTFGSGLGGNVQTIAFMGDTLWVGGDFYYDDSFSTPLFDVAWWDGTNWIAAGPAGHEGTEASMSVSKLVRSGDSLLALGGFSTMVGQPSSGFASFRRGSWTTYPDCLYGVGYDAINTSKGLFVGGNFSRIGVLGARDLANRTLAGWSLVLPAGSDAIGGYNELLGYSLANNSRYVFLGGLFHHAGSIAANNIVAWDKKLKKWTALGEGVNGEVSVVKLYGDDLYVGGLFNRAGTVDARHIARYNLVDQQWHAMGAGSSRNVVGIAANATGVYASVFYPNEGGVLSNYMGRWDGSQWQKLDGAFNGFANAVEAIDSTVFVGGSITTVDGNPIGYVMKHDKNGWDNLNGGLSYPVYALLPDAGGVYAGGNFARAMDGTPLHCLGYYDNSSSTWTGFGQGFNDQVLSLCKFGSTLYAGGNFTWVDGTTVAHLAAWDGAQWSDASGGATNRVTAITSDSATIYVTGGFAHVGSTIFSWRFGALHLTPLSVDRPTTTATNLSLTITPVDGASVEVSYTLPSSMQSNVILYDMLGRQATRLEAGAASPGLHFCVIPVRQLSQGTYILRIETPTGNQSALLTVVH